MLFTEPTILIHFKSVRVILFVFHCVVIALFALGASKCYFYSHNGTSRFTEIFFAFTLTVVKVNASLGSGTKNMCHTANYCMGEKSNAQYILISKQKQILCKKKEPSEVITL